MASFSPGGRGNGWLKELRPSQLEDCGWQADKDCSHKSGTALYVTGFWKTDHNVTLGQLHFLGPANSHAHTLSMHCCNTRLSCLVCFSRADFADHVKPRLRQWDPWRALDGRYGSDIHPCISETSHRPSRLVKDYG